MKNTDTYLQEIKEIRQMMEQSSRFLSLSGLSGILVGLYALVSAFVAYQLINSPASLDDLRTKLILLAVTTLFISFVTVLWLTSRRIKKTGGKFWNAGSRLMSLHLAIPLVTGGLLILIFIDREIYSIVSPACLVFYGLALVNAAKFTRQEIFYMGLLQLILGIFAALFPGLGLVFWAMGFGVVHIIYGLVMYFRYESNSKLA